jgi:hypothetical protein
VQSEFLQVLQRKQEIMNEERKTKKYGGHTPSDTDIVIDGYRLICTCPACPEQYDVFNNENGSLVGYLRLRHGTFRADCPDVGGETVYTANPVGDGIFEDHERMDYLHAAVTAIRAYWDKLKKEYGNETE